MRIRYNNSNRLKEGGFIGLPVYTIHSSVHLTVLAIALALIYPLAISNNPPFSMIAAYFRDLAPWLLIEFVPKSDSQVLRFLASREDFENTYQQAYDTRKVQDIRGSQHRLYLMERK